MKLAISDACIFIDVYHLELTAHFFELETDIHTSYDVFNELYAHQKEQLTPYLNSGRLTLHNLDSKDRLVMYSENYPRSFSDNDKTVLYVANKIDAMVLSSDKIVRSYAKQKAIGYHGMLWIFDQLVEALMIEPKEAAEKLQHLISTNFLYRYNKDLVKELNTHLNRWGSSV